MEYPDDMSESDIPSTAADLEALRALQADASDLERIEELLRSLGIGNTNKVHARYSIRTCPLSLHHSA
jgi:hypothetical protein